MLFCFAHLPKEKFGWRKLTYNGLHGGLQLSVRDLPIDVRLDTNDLIEHEQGQCVSGVHIKLPEPRA